MLPSEMIILMAIAVNQKTGKNLLSRPMDATGEYIGYLFNSLVNRGYLKQNGAQSYQLTPMGHDVIFDFIKKNQTRLRDIVRRLRLLGIDMSPEQEQKFYEMGIEVSHAR